MKSDQQIFEFMQALSGPATFKDPKTGKYFCANVPSVRIHGLDTPDQIIGLTVHDLSFSKSSWGEAWAQETKKMDWLVQEKKEMVKNLHPFLTADGSLKYLITKKFPLLGSRRNVLGIVTFDEDWTRNISNYSLYLSYKKICGKKIAIKKLLQHLEIESWFFTLPTEKELLVLFDRVAGKTDKEIAKLHHVSVRTTETHLINLRTKLQGEALPNIITYLRTRQHGIDLVKHDFIKEA